MESLNREKTPAQAVLPSMMIFPGKDTGNLEESFRCPFIPISGQ